MNAETGVAPAIGFRNPAPIQEGFGLADRIEEAAPLGATPYDLPAACSKCSYGETAGHTQRAFSGSCRSRMAALNGLH